jgi:hypothetical protein
MQSMVSKIRQLEVKEIFKNEIVGAVIEMYVFSPFFNYRPLRSFDTAPFLATLATFYGYVIIDEQVLTPKTAFVTLFLFDLIRFSVYKLPQLVTSTVTTLISMRRVLKFLNESEREEIIVDEFKNGVDEFIGNKLKLTIKKTDFYSRN